jgi:outer membrane protein OmpA-like peptidoglycan-associated protein
MQFLISHGVKADLLSAKGYGEADPVAPNTTPAGRSQNRRVEITLASQGG